MAINPLNNHYAMENGATIYDEESLTALQLAARTAAKTNEAVEAFNTLETKTNEHLTAQDQEIAQRTKAQDDRITEMNGVTMPAKVVSEFQKNLDNGTFENMVDEYAGELTDRLDNLLGSVNEGSTTLDAEVIDLRVDEKGNTHANAGEAFRKTSTRKADLTTINRFFDLDIMRGQFENVYPHGDVTAQYKSGNYQNILSPSFPLTKGHYTLFVSQKIGFRGYVEKVGGLETAALRTLTFDNAGIHTFYLDEDSEMDIRLLINTDAPVEIGEYGLYGLTILKGDYTMQALLPDFVTGVNLAVEGKRDVKRGYNLFNKDSAFNVKGYLSPEGKIYLDNPNFVVSHYIDVEPNTEYNYIELKGSAAAICFYDDQYIFLGSVQGYDLTDGTFTTPANAAKMRISASIAKNVQVVKGNYALPYEPFTDSKDIIDLQKDVNLLKESLGVGDHKPAYLTAEGDGNLTIEKIVNVKKNNVLSFYGHFASFNGLRIGHGESSVGGSYIEIDGQNVTYYFVGADVVPYEPIAHGLNISDFIDVTISADTVATVTITTASGTATIETPHWSGCNGYVFAKGINTNLTNGKLTWATKDINAPVWLFGDSYTSHNSDERIPKHIIDMGYDNWLISGFPGGVGAPEVESFTNLLEMGKPKVAVWCLGMNHPDTNGVLNPSWVTTVNSFINLCNANGVVPVLATIPTTPTVNNDPKNAWVKASGLRFVDYEKAVINPATGEWYANLLHADQVHPTTQGAKVLASRLLLDVPEITF